LTGRVVFPVVIQYFRVTVQYLQKIDVLNDKERKDTVYYYLPQSLQD